jgi:Asp-tRNA(Asn)/Glu-tRNA(Gln) amidotransferase B subunit
MLTQISRIVSTEVQREMYSAMAEGRPESPDRAAAKISEQIGVAPRTARQLVDLEHVIAETEVAARGGRS